jgi:hypothetical protein
MLAGSIYIVVGLEDLLFTKQSFLACALVSTYFTLFAITNIFTKPSVINVLLGGVAISFSLTGMLLLSSILKK